MAKKKMSAKQAKYFGKKRGLKKKTPVLGVDYGTGTVMYGPHRKRGRKAKLHFADGSYSAISDRNVYVHKGGVKRFKGRRLKGSGKKKGGHVPLDILKTRLKRLTAIVKSRTS